MAPDHLRDGDANCVQGKGGRVSKAQAALAKIIEVISTIPPPPSFLTVESKTKAPIVADAELKLGMEGDGIINGGTNNSSASLVIDHVPRDDDVAMEDDDDELISPIPGDAPRKHQTRQNRSEGECNRNEDEKKGNGEISEEEEEEEKMNLDQGENCKGGSTSSAWKENNNNNKGSKEGYLDLLLEAVQHELPLDQDEEEEQGKVVQECSEELNKDAAEERVGHRSCWSKKLDLYSEESSAPMARSKRGIRNQTLPSRSSRARVRRGQASQPPQDDDDDDDDDMMGNRGLRSEGEDESIIVWRRRGWGK